MSPELAGAASPSWNRNPLGVYDHREVLFPGLDSGFWTGTLDSGQDSGLELCYTLYSMWISSS